MLLSLINKVLRHTIKISHWKLLLMAVVFIAMSSFSMYFIEPKTFKDPFIGFWYVMTTVSQVGFGDYIPKTIMGRLYTIIIYLVGVGLFAICVTKLVDFLNKYQEFKEMEVMGFNGKNHMIMINWSQKTKITIEEILDNKQDIEIVLIDQLNTSPIKHKNVHYIQGKATKSEILQKANVLQAESICIFAPDYGTDEMSTDGKTLLIASKIKQFVKQNNTEAYIIGEILDEDHIANNIQDFMNEFILSNKPFSHLMAATAMHKSVNYSS